MKKESVEKKKGSGVYSLSGKIPVFQIGLPGSSPGIRSGETKKVVKAHGYAKGVKSKKGTMREAKG